MPGQAFKRNKIQILTAIFKVIIIKDLYLKMSSKSQLVLPTSPISWALLNNTFFKSIMHKTKHSDPIARRSTSMGRPSSQTSSSRLITEVTESSTLKGLIWLTSSKTSSTQAQYRHQWPGISNPKARLPTFFQKSLKIILCHKRSKTRPQELLHSRGRKAYLRPV